MKTYFVTGTDTEVGKSFVTATILKCLSSAQYKTLGFKPIAAGCEQTADGLRNEDGLLLQDASSLDVPYELVNPIAFEPPVAPHLAAKQENKVIDTPMLSDTLATLQGLEPDLLLVEGAGGWRLPLGNGRYLSDWCVEETLPVILVVGVKLGCLNHAVLTAEAIKRDGLKLAGWIANYCDEEMPLLNENVASLKSLIDAPMLGEVKRAANSDEAGKFLEISTLETLL
ncbi:dethiobiotin synthase [Alteromonadaceae bacterium M269]|nr:dethiobiotin synthase [Alteromonadaceae bacterium M269]